ncbi:hypothetical protein K469DRAFT_685938 [Zopfia rhizophila CBS 207.26]|uniref:NACHT domain-containing protein n=1 Tax=Zopfia rhizophila CBS 207.26 TaxID=1314779 RepID=A0A6A6EA82_9PEZI|nr:hypothetical protein K469DRAFT_685938 [Zopfia rhizophila CBS 207.26]
MLVEAIEREKSLLRLALTDEYRLLIRAIKNNSGGNQRLLLELSYMIKGKSMSLENDIQELRKQNINTDQQAILNWLNPIDYASQQSDFLSRRQEGTGQWLLESAEFQGWLNNRKQSLFCPGIPGAGKTILTSIVIEKLYNHFQDDGNVSIAHLYCNFRRKNEQDTLDLLANMLKQLTQSLSTVPESLKSLYDNLSSKMARPSFEDISKAVFSVVALQNRACVLVDALDECQPTAGNALKLLTFLFNLQIRASDEDLRRYLQGHMSQLPRLVQTKQGLQEQIVAEITKFVDGMYVVRLTRGDAYADGHQGSSCHSSLSSLEDKTTPKAMKTALAQLRQDVSIPNRDEKQELLGRAYGQAMERIQSQKAGFKALAERVPSWIVCAKRQLTTIELQHALAIEPDELALDMDNPLEAEDMSLVCAGLVTIDEDAGIIRPVHYTLQECFEGTWNTWFPRATAAITKACVTYLSFKAFESGWCPTGEQFEARLRSYPLYDYAARF